MSIFKTGLGALTAAALVLVAAHPANAAGTSNSAAQAQTVKVGTSDATDFRSARRRRVARGNNGGAAAAAAFAGIVGTAIAAGVARDRYDDGYYYGRRGYYGGGPAYYNGPGYGYGGGYGRW